ncbi:MoxR-like ATPase [Malonomonas rubra DSM 5091]|uniref:MoxR-like ATPase n=1 Tax=Malonomonas rubra DSM 5091 TaxID=1122189 RepID=A0A1M6BTN3_MALRU|nr:MoxR family ATPase [Malonomonas rubra]SHI51953.1 MoxR-like ATPase [Malonomonas rubra DSM 5091]
MELYQRKQILEVIETLSSKYLQGKVRAIRLAIVSLLAGGHILLEDIPGLGKTSLALALSGILDLDFGRVQCTSDLLPSDITGLSVFDRQKSEFKFVKGPIFNNLVLVDEVNRAMPKTQSAMLEAMEERRVTVEGVTYGLPEPFLVIATQNPAEQVGTFPLPESQLDRFLITTGIGYPPPELEKQIIQRGSVRDELETIKPLLGRDKIIETSRFIRDNVKLGDLVADYIHTLIERSRNHPQVFSGISTRGGLSLAAAARAEAYLEGRDYVVPEDVQQIAVPVVAHRLILRPEFQTVRKEEVFQSLLAEIPVPMA